jgi:bacterioferritin (cytochrome b1)
MPRKRKERERKAERDAQVERARQLRERIAGLGGTPKPATPRELTDEAAMREYVEEKQQRRDSDEKDC